MKQRYATYSFHSPLRVRVGDATVNANNIECPRSSIRTKDGQEFLMKKITSAIFDILPDDPGLTERSALLGISSMKPLTPRLFPEADAAVVGMLYSCCRHEGVICVLQDASTARFERVRFPTRGRSTTLKMGPFLFTGSMNLCRYSERSAKQHAKRLTE